ncbi:pimeloyl-ACP methyl ester carboxylesterase [Nocardiopsis mwathae]|uniref:Pimeloyl-ACP methyl ester carboxylesterase n=1 Tax=Nocardiopsis mwathae TaxID=1472723 RepID=A0A7W9YLV1_9ACTN|nr:alpha/beta fold hydrolase [Nocardiopsis mwathae]MBB6174375.1 pimeloyl-ACP methyl ester carboxylesterase [Nocardiopsis mwathae]
MISHGNSGVLVGGTGPGLLLAHGAGSDVQDSFGPVLDRLTRGNTVVGPDYPGSGRTPSAPAPLELDDLADHIVAAAVDRGVDTFAVAGFSMGTAVAVRTAVRFPERVTALVLSAGLARADARLRLIADTWRSLAASPDRRALASYLSLLVNSPEWLGDRTPDEIEAQLAEFAAGTPEGTGDHLELLARVDVRADLDKVAVPTLVVSPTRDLLLPPSHARELASGISGARLVGLDSGHAIAAEKPAEWADLITGFLTATGS